MPPKRKKRSKSMPKQRQSQRQSVVVNIGTSKTKSKPRKSRGRGGLPPPSYQHNLAPTFVTQQATDYNPVIGAIASLTAKLNEQPRIQQPVTPLSSTTSFSTQQAQAMAGQMAEERRAGPTAANLQPLPSQADERLSMSMEDRPPVRAPDPIIRERLVKDDKASDRGGIPEATAYVKRGRPFARATQSYPLNQTYLIARYPRAEAESDSSLSVSSDSEGPAAGGGGPPRVFKTPPKVLAKARREERESLIVSSDNEGPAAGGGGPPKVFKTPPKVLAKARRQEREKRAKLASIREKMKDKQQITTEERQFVMKSRGAKKLQKSLELMNKVGSSDRVGSTQGKIKRDTEKAEFI